MTLKRTMCALLAASMMTSGFIATTTSASAATVDNESGASAPAETSSAITLPMVPYESGATAPTESSANPYNLASSPADGNILHCLNWKLSDIKAEIPNIAKAGFTSVQTSPLQAHDGSDHWYWLYQPINFWPGNELGSEDDLKALCAEAENYGVKVIVDIVANHFAGNHSNIPDELKGSEYYHNSGYGTSQGQTGVDWGNRWQVTHCDIGMPDLNSEHSLVQQYVRNYVNRLEQDGVDGVRWDAAKHIGLPSENCNFWPSVLSSTMYNYGEILDSPGGDGATVMKEYTDYMSVTDNQYSNNTRNAFQGGNVMDGYGQWTAQGVPATGIVYWAESHDTFFNKMESQSANTYIINKAYAAIGSRYGSQALYMSRPTGAWHHDQAGYGEKGDTSAAFSKEVTAVNNFRNAMGSKKDYYLKSNGCAVITRQGGGAVIVKGDGNGQVTVENGGGYAKTGSYKDAISGNTFTVTSTSISGTIGDTGIAVIYDASDIPAPDPSGSVSATPTSGTTFSDTLTVTLKASDVTNAKYTTSEGATGTFTNGQTIVVGASTAAGSTVTVSLSGTKTDGSTATASYTYTKTAPKTYPTLSGAGFVFDNSTKNWSTVNAYVYDESGSSVVNNASWPGLAMTNCGNGYWKYDLDSKFSGSNIRVIFNNGSEQIPASQQPGFQMSSSDKKVYENDSWNDLPATSNLKVSLAASATSVTAGTAVTLTATATGASGNVTYSYKAGSTAISGNGSSVTWTPTTAGTYTITVTATDSSSSATATKSITVTAPVTTDPTVTVDKASGTSFTSETMDIKLTLANATSGTYSVDNGPTKSFTGSKTVTIGEGKIGDSTVTVKTTATNSSGTTKTYTFTYEKKYTVKTSTSASAQVTAATSGGASSCSKYSTNPNGQVGKQKTITSASDFTEDMIVAQGIANDDPATFRGPHEAPRFDQYALYAAWDNTNLYVGIQYTNVCDVVATDQDAVQGGRAKPNGADADIPQMLLFDTKTGNYTDGSTNSASQSTVWNTQVTFDTSTTKVDKILMYSPKEGINNYSVFPVTNGKIDYVNAVSPGYQVALPGASITWEDGFFGSHIYGISGNGYTGYKPSDITDSANWTDFINHRKDLDTFCIITLPLSYLGVTASDISSNGIGLMAVATYGESGIGCLPHDTCMLDNAMEAYSKDDSTSGEKDDADKISVALASVGAQGDFPIPTPTTPLQVNFGTDRSAPQLSTTALTLKGIGYGGTAPYKYQFSVDGNVVKASNTTDTYSWTPGSVGSHTIKCVITDSTGATATVSKTFTAEGSTTSLTNTSTVSSSITLGNTINITGKATGGTAPYKYSYYYKQASQDTWSTKLANTTTTSTTVKPGTATTYNIKVKVTDASGATAEKTYNCVVNPSSTTLTNTSTVSSSITLGNTINITGKATGGTTPYKFSYYYKQASQTAWSTKLENTTTTSTTVKPGTATTYNIKVKVTDAAGKTAEKTYNCVVNPSSTTLTNTSTVSSAITLGNTINITGKATGGTTPYKYSYYYKQASQSTWSTKLENTTTTSTTVKPGTATTYNIKVKVTDAAGKTAEKTYNCVVNSATLTNSSTCSSSIYLGQTINITGKATGGTAPYKYSYYYKQSSSSSWSTKLANTTTTSTTVKPGTATTYNIKVKVTDAAGKTAEKTFNVSVKKPAALVNNSKVASTSIVVGNTINVTAAATGGTGGYKYTYFFKKSNQSAWTQKSVANTATSTTIKPGSTGTYNVMVTITDSAGTTASKTFNVTVKTGTLTNASKVASTTITLGDTIKITGAATGGSGGYKYTYYFKQSASSSWTKKDVANTTTSTTVKPSTATTYNIKVVVTDSAGKTAEKTFNVRVQSAALTNKSSVSATSITLGTTITLKGAATGGSGSYTYSYYFKQASASSWTIKGDQYTTSTSVTLKPSVKTTYNIKIVVRDKTTGEVVEKTMNVTVK